MVKLSLKELNNESVLGYIVCTKNGSIVYKNESASKFLSSLKIDSKSDVLEAFAQIFPKFNLDNLLNKPEVFNYTDEEDNIQYFKISVYEKIIDEFSYFVFNIYDISEFKNEVLESKIYETIFNSAASAIVLTDTRGTIEKVNPAFQKLTGYTEEEAVGGNPRILKSGYHSEQFFEEMWKTLSKGEIWRGNLRDKIKSGELIWEKSVISPIRDASGNIIKYIAIKENITKEKANEEALKKYSYQDFLTGLYNRRKFSSYVEELMEEAKKKDIYLFCLMIDLDDFKCVNDNYGHEVGDNVLVCLADILKTNVRGNDIASRYGGEEFVVILSKYSHEEALKRAEKIRADIESAVVKTNQDEISVTASIGFAKYDNNSSILEWLEMADKALYEAKNSGKNKVVEYPNS